MIDRDRTFHRLVAATRKRKAEDRQGKRSFSPALRNTHPWRIPLKPEDIVPAIGVKLTLATRPSILAGESGVICSIKICYMIDHGDS